MLSIISNLTRLSSSAISPRGIPTLKYFSRHFRTTKHINKKMTDKSIGLIPPLTFTDVNYMKLAHSAYYTRLNRFTDDLDKYDWLMSLHDREMEAFYHMFNKYPDQIMPLVYTPTVGMACQNLGLVYSCGRGLFISINDKGNIETLLRSYKERDIRAICVTDGERILGLGDQGVYGMGIPVGKLSLYTGLAGIPPQHCLPITLDVGTNSKVLIEDLHYFGLKQARVTGPAYDEFIDEFMTACVKIFGKKVLIQFEDFANHNAFRLMQKYSANYATFNDDIQGTASVVLAGVLASQGLTNRQLKDEVILCYGSGEASLGFAHLVTCALTRRFGLSPEEAKRNLYLMDSKGLVVEGRQSGGLTAQKMEFARPAGTPELTTLEEIIKYTKCTALLGAAAVPHAFTPSVLRLMAKQNEKPLIMALSNPTPIAECTAEEAYLHTGGRCIFASGSPFPPLSLSPDVCPAVGAVTPREPGQANNAYVFPGVALGIVSGQISPVTNDDFLVASETLASLVSEADYAVGRLFPPLDQIRGVSTVVARNLILAAAEQGRVHAVKEKPTAAQVDKLISPFSNFPPPA